MPSSRPLTPSQLTRRRFFQVGLAGAAGLALYSGEIARHSIEITYPEIRVQGLPVAFDGFRIVQLSDIHFDQFTEPYFLREAVHRINQLRPDAIFLTGDFVTFELLPRPFAVRAGWNCARILERLACTARYAILGNHDVIVDPLAISMALTQSGITVLRNSFTALEHGSSRIWLAGLDDAVEGKPDLDRAIPTMLHNRPEEPVFLLCHEPDYTDTLLNHPAASSVQLVFSGHTHGGQIRFPLVGPVTLPELGKKYVEGLFRLQGLQLYVNRGLGTVGVPFRLNCPPEISLITLRRA